MRDLVGETFGNLTVLRRDNITGKTKWLCRCSCGKEASVFEHNLVSGRSCRCNDWKRHPRATREHTSECDLAEDIVVVKCADGERFIVDKDDINVVKDRSWYKTRNGNFYTNVGRKKCSVHRLIAGAGEIDEVDHISRDKCDNRRANLRFCSHAENQRNIGMKSDNKTGYKGVFLPKRRKRYVASIKHNKQPLYIGSFETPIEAAQAYDVAAKLLHGDFASLNNVPPPTRTFRRKIADKISRLSSGGFLLPENEV